MIIALSGFMGCGKSSSGKILAEKMGFKFCDLDAEIELRNNIKISCIFEKYGESRFRQIEFATLEQIISENGTQNMILALGGGTQTYEKSRDLIARHCFCIYIRVNETELIKILEEYPGDRPLLKGTSVGKVVKELLKKREPAYMKNANKILAIEKYDCLKTAEELKNIVSLFYVSDT